MFLAFNISICASQNLEKDTLTTDNEDSEYIQHYNNFIAFRVGFNNDFNRFKFKVDPQDSHYYMNPNQRIRTTFSLIFHFVEIDIPFTPGFLKANRDDDTHGKTKFFGLGTRFFLGKWMQHLQWTTTKGFYVDSGELGLPEGDNLIFSDLKVFKIGGSTSYIFNSNYSFRAVSKQREWQKKSAGSFIPTFSYYYSQITNNTPETNDIYNLAIGPAYHYNWVIKDHFMVSGGIYTGIGYNNTGFQFTDDRNDYTIDGLTFETQFKISLGYNSTRFYMGANASFSSAHYEINPKIKYEDQHQFIEIYFGYRFKAPNKLIKKANEVETKYGI